MTEKETVITAVNFFGIRILDLFRISNFGFRIYLTSAGSRARR